MNAFPAPGAGRRRVLIVDDHPIVRKGLRGLIDAEQDLEVAAEAAGAGDALAALRSARPDVVLLDISLEGCDGLELTKMILAELPRLPILIVSMHDESTYAERVLRAGARGYIMKQEVAENIVHALRTVLHGEIYLSTTMKERLVERSAGGAHVPPDSASAVDVLTDRELEVFRLIGRGMSTRHIAEQLHLSVKTIESHRARIKIKLGIETAPELVRRAVQWSDE